MSSQRTKWIVLIPMSEPGGASRFANESIAAITAPTRRACCGSTTVTRVSWFWVIASSRNDGSPPPPVDDGISSPGASGAHAAQWSSATLLQADSRGGRRFLVIQLKRRKTGYRPRLAVTVAGALEDVAEAPPADRLDPVDHDRRGADQLREPFRDRPHDGRRRAASSRSRRARPLAMWRWIDSTVSSRNAM